MTRHFRKGFEKLGWQDKISQHPLGNSRFSPGLYDCLITDVNTRPDEALPWFSNFSSLAHWHQRAGGTFHWCSGIQHEWVETYLPPTLFPRSQHRWAGLFLAPPMYFHSAPAVFSYTLENCSLQLVKVMTLCVCTSVFCVYQDPTLLKQSFYLGIHCLIFKDSPSPSIAKVHPILTLYPVGLSE